MKPRFCTLVALFACAPAAQTPDAVPWGGEWEGFVETTRQTVYVVVRFDERTIRLGGNSLDLLDLTLSDDSVSFLIDLGPQQLAFRGTHGSTDEAGGGNPGTVLVGQVLASLTDSEDPSAEFTFELFRLPEFAPPTSRIEAWEQDLAHVRARFLRYDRSYSALDRARAFQLLDRLEAEVADLDDPRIIAGIARIAATADNAHTRFYLLRNRTALRRVPIRLWWFDDGLFVIRATERYPGIIGCRVEGIGGQPATTVRSAVSGMFAGNESWRDYKSTYFMTAPAALTGVGVGEDPTSTRFDLSCEDGPHVVTAKAEPLVRLDEPTENWRNLSPAWRGELDLLPPEEGEWIAPLRGVVTPLYLSYPERNYWMEVLPRERTVYVHYARSQNAADGESIEAFADRVIETLDRPEFEAVIVDLRFNTGGDVGAAESFFERLVAHPDLVGGGRLAVIVGQATFSAGLFHAAQLRASGLATLVGREPGDRLDYWSEGGNLVLPNSGYTLHFANGYHSYSGRPDPSVEKIFRSLSVESLAPDIEIRMTAEAYRSGDDPLLDAALEGIRSSFRE